MSKQIKVVLTGASGMVGEGVLLECLQNEKVSEVLMVNRNSQHHQHPKLKELVVRDFTHIDQFHDLISGYDACFYCAGKTSAGMNEEDYTHLTYTTTMAFAEALKNANPDMVFHFVSGSHTDSTEKGKVMWARVKGKTENALMQLFPSKQYNYRPALMKPTKGQKNFRGYNRMAHKILYPGLSLFFPSCKIEEIGKAMINATFSGYSNPILEAPDIKKLGAN